MTDDSRTGLYQSWNEDLRMEYLPTLKDSIKILRSIPAFPDLITDLDVQKLVMVLLAFKQSGDNVFEEIEKNIQILMGKNAEFDLSALYDPNVFYIVKGIVMGIAIHKIEKGLLKPGNPLDEALKEEDKNATEGIY